MEDKEGKVCKEIKSVIFISKSTLLLFVRIFRNKLKSFILLQLFYSYIYVQLFFSLLKNIFAMLKNSTQIGFSQNLNFKATKLVLPLICFVGFHPLNLASKLKNFSFKLVISVTKEKRVLSIFLPFFFFFLCKRSLLIFVTS